MTHTTITPATRADLDEIVDLLAEVEDFYNEAEPTDTISRNTEHALFGPIPRAHAILARTGTHLAGFAAYSFLWPAAGSTTSLYLKEMYVRTDSRRQGIGRQLMDQLTKIAAEHQCSRIEWTTDTSNQDAQRFYANTSSTPTTDKILYRIDLT
jgi:ribosomal protein S18 acetylase RimI-like enzyme